MKLQTALPGALAEFIRRAAKTKTAESKLTRLARYILGKYRSAEIPLDEPIEISVEHFRRQIGTHYLNDLNVFRAGGVIVSSRSYTVGTRNDRGERLTLGKCKTHHFAPEYVCSDPEIVTFNEQARARFDMTDPVIRSTVPILARLKLTLSETELRRYVKELVTDQYIRNRCRINEEIPPGYHYLKNDPVPKELKFLLHIARRSGLDLIQYREKCYLASADQFIERRVYDTRQNYLDALLRIKESRKRPALYCARNATNTRLDTNLTNLKSELLEIVRLDGERLGSIDLSNSQPVLLAHVIEQSFEYVNSLGNRNKLEKNLMCAPAKRTSYLKEQEKGLSTEFHQQSTDKEIISTINVTHFSKKNPENEDITCSIPNDLREYIELTKSGKFYEKFAELLSAEGGQVYTRAEAKRILFLTLFSAHRYNPPEKQLLARHYPSLVLWTNEFKRLSIAYKIAEGIPANVARDQGNARLAVMLQTIEAAIFIDTILERLLSEGFRCFTKHDSFLCKLSDLSKVTAIVTQELDDVLGAGEYQLKIETV